MHAAIHIKREHASHQAMYFLNNGWKNESYDKALEAYRPNNICTCLCVGCSGIVSEKDLRCHSQQISMLEICCCWLITHLLNIDSEYIYIYIFF